MSYPPIGSKKDREVEQLRSNRDNWKASAISAINRAEKAEAEVERLRKLCAEAAEWCYKHTAGDDDWKTLYRRLTAEVPRIEGDSVISFPKREEE